LEHPTTPQIAVAAAAAGEQLQNMYSEIIDFQLFGISIDEYYGKTLRLVTKHVTYSVSYSSNIFFIKAKMTD